MRDDPRPPRQDRDEHRDHRCHRRAARAARAAFILACATPPGALPVGAQPTGPKPTTVAFATVPGTALVRDSAFGTLERRCPRARLSGACGAPVPPARYTGSDALGVPRYIGDVFTDEERRLLRAHFGVEHPERLYISIYGFLTYDTQYKRGLTHIVPSHRIAGRSVRAPGESWEQFERRVRRMRPADFGPDALRVETSLDALDPAVRGDFKRMLADARRAGFDVHVTETRRSPARQAYLLGRGDGSTFTGTSFHSDGYAADVVVGDGKLGRAATRARWIEFRRWVVAYDRRQFQLIGTPEQSWDFAHVAIAGNQPGFRTIEDCLAAAYAAESGPGQLARATR